MSNQRMDSRFSTSILVIMGILSFVFSSHAQENPQRKDGEKSERLIMMAVEYPGVQIPLDEDLSMDITFNNKGSSDETVKVRVTQTPQGWKTRIKAFRYDVNAVTILSGESKTLTFEATADESVSAGPYAFRVEAETADGHFKMGQDIVATIKNREKVKGKGIRIITSYPVLQGPSDGKFEFSLEVASKLPTDSVFDLSFQGPDDWDIKFKPAYEKKYISSIRLKAHQTSTVAVEVEPAPMSRAGEYPFTIRVGSPEAEAEANLTVVLTGIYQLEIGTSTGLLSLDAKQGKPANMSVYVKNTGSAVNNNIEFMSLKPENWKVAFSPDNITAIPPGDLKQVEVMITPYEEAIVGDYSISVRVEGEKAARTMEFRVTVKASSAWGWVGIVVILMVIVGLAVLFRFFGRR